MIRLRPTGIDISQNDLGFHLQQLDIYEGLLKQGFRKSEIIQYFEDQNTKQKSDEFAAEDLTVAAPSTNESSAEQSPCSPKERPLSAADFPRQGVDDFRGHSPSAGTSQNWQQSSQSPPTILRRSFPEQRQNFQNHAPRQSSLLRLTRGISSNGSSEDERKAKMSFSPGSKFRYRQRSETYSYDQSEVEENDSDNDKGATLYEFEHLSLDQELVPPSANFTRTTIRIVSNLRPEAESFTPLHLRLESAQTVSKDKYENESSPSSDDVSLPSSPPLLPKHEQCQIERRSPSLPRAPRTPSPYPNPMPPSGRHIQQRYLDGSFNVYDDSVASRLQPQTPADLSRSQHLNEFNAAFTAPPGMFRSPLPPHGSNLRQTRQAPSDLSPTAGAILMRERRQREFIRGARIEGLMLDRIRNTGTMARATTGDELDNVWRDNLDADAVGEENFEDPTLLTSFRRLRTVSGNRRAH